jgi:hypothetical protein
VMGMEDYYSLGCDAMQSGRRSLFSILLLAISHLNQHWSSPGVPKVAGETAALPSVKFNFWGMPSSVPMCPVVMGSSSYSVMHRVKQQFQRHLKMTNIG